MNERQFYDWQTLGGGNDVATLVTQLDASHANWCMIGGLAVNHWSVEPMATADVDIVSGVEQIDACVAALERVGFIAQRFERSINLKGTSTLGRRAGDEGPHYQRFSSPKEPSPPTPLPGNTRERGAKFRVAPNRLQRHFHKAS